jgi:hypothetical protein
VNLRSDSVVVGCENAGELILSFAERRLFKLLGSAAIAASALREIKLLVTVGRPSEMLIGHRLTDSIETIPPPNRMSA